MTTAGINHARKIALRALLRRADPHQLGRSELLLMVDLLASALAVGDSSADFGEQALGR